MKILVFLERIVEFVPTFLKSQFPVEEDKKGVGAVSSEIIPSGCPSDDPDSRP